MKRLLFLYFFLITLIAVAKSVTDETAVPLANIKPISDSAGDGVYAGNGIIAIHALKTGMKTLRWRGKKSLMDLSTGKIVCRDCESYSFKMKLGDSHWFKKISKEGI